jgi:hypothetical protein
MRYHRIIVAAIALVFASVSLVHGYPDGSNFNGRTGAPGDGTCASCHGGSGALNTGAGSASILIPGSLVAGDTLTVTSRVRQIGQVRWGFELTVLDGTDQPTGEILVTDAARTLMQVANGGRQYIKHTDAGTDDGTPDSTSWSFRWVAPDPLPSQVTFYMAGLASNSGSGTNGDSTYTQFFTFLATGVGDDYDQSLPSGYRLAQNYPNPFNPTTTIEYSLPERAWVTLTVYDVSGRVVRVLDEGSRVAGDHVAVWDGLASNGSPAASGVYFYRLDAGKQSLSHKMTLLK